MSKRWRRIACNLLVISAGLGSSIKAQTFSAGQNHSLFSCAGGIPQGVGSNSSGELGIGSYVSHINPVSISSLNGIIAVEGSYGNSLFLKNNGTVWSVGANSHGQLGDGSTTSKLTPVRVSGLTGITAMSAGMFFSVFLKNDGTVWATGINNSGQLGDGTTENKSIAVQVPGLTGITAISCGMYHTLFLKSDGTVWATGGNYYGQVGNQPLFGVTTPVQITGVDGVTAISAGGTHSLFLKSDGTVWGIGSNAYGQLGESNLGQYNYNVLQVTGLSGITALSGGYLYSLFLKGDGTVWASGANMSGELGDGTTVDKSIPFTIPGLNGIVAINAGVHSSLFLKGDGTISGSGGNYSGMLGDGTNIQRLTPASAVNICPNNLAIADPSIENDLSIYPNPCHEQLFIKIDGQDAESVAKLYTLQGQLLERIILKESITVIPVDYLSTGIYLVTVKNARGSFSKKIVRN